MYLHFSDLETTLLPYFLFVVYGAIVLWARSESLEREYVEPEPEPESEPELPQEFTLSVPIPSVGRDLDTEFSLEVLTRELTATDNHFTPEAAEFLLAETGLPAVALQALARELDKVSPSKLQKPRKRIEETPDENV